MQVTCITSSKLTDVSLCIPSLGMFKEGQLKDVARPSVIKPQGKL
jgi:hypothetical protein